MLVEHVLRANGVKKKRVPFAEKSKKLKKIQPAALPVPLDSDPEVWHQLGALYDAFQDARHAVTHRRAGTSQAGDIEVFSDQRVREDSITRDEIRDFAGAVHGAAELMIEQARDDRRLDFVRGHLNALAHRHGRSLYAVAAPGDDHRLLKAHLEDLQDDRFVIEMTRIREVIELQPETAYWTIELYSDDRLFVGHWEEIPGRDQDSVDFDAANPPSWLTEEIRSGEP
jgi:hypothetical protein